jgi:hypothetical protein
MKPHWYVPYILAAAIIAAYELVFKPLQGARIAPSESLLMKNDVEIGSKIDLPRRDVHGREIPPGERLLIVYAGMCSQCTQSATSNVRLTGKVLKNKVVVYLASKKQVIEQVGAPLLGVYFVADPEGDFAYEVLGARSAPRFNIVERSVIVDVWKNLSQTPTEWLK